MTSPIPARSRQARPSRRARRGVLVPVALALALLTSACDKCGDYLRQGGSKSCHDESQLK